MSPVLLKERTVTTAEHYVDAENMQGGIEMAEIGMGKKKGLGHSTQEEE